MNEAPTPSAADLQAAFEASAFHRLIRGRLEVTGAGIVLTAEIGADFSTALGRAHGGVVASLLDTAATWALITGTARPWVTADLRIDYLRAVALGQVRVEASVVRTGRRIGTAKAAIVTEDGIAATSIGTFLPLEV